MGLDIYAGTLTRYYSRNWKTIVQQQAQANGQECVVINGFGGEMKAVEDDAEISGIRDTIGRWSENLAATIYPHNSASTHHLWPEAIHCPYFTDKPDWLAYGALIMLVACRLQNCQLPEYVENRWSAFDEAVVKKCMTRHTGNSLLSNVVMWLPIADNSVFVTAMPTGDEAAVATLQLLKQELDELNRQLWNADEATMLSWRDDKYYVPTTITETKRLFGFIPRTKQKVVFRTEDLAQCAFSILYQAVDFALEHNVPLLLDY